MIKMLRVVIIVIIIILPLYSSFGLIKSITPNIGVKPAESDVAVK